MLTFPQTHDIMTKCIENLSNIKWKRKMESDLVNIYAIYRVEWTNGKHSVKFKMITSKMTMFWYVWFAHEKQSCKQYE